MSEPAFARWFEKDIVPSVSAIRRKLGSKAAQHWEELCCYLDENYDFQPLLKYYGKKYGWTVQYRRSGKTLCSLFPEKGAFTVLVTLGPKELERLKPSYYELSPDVRRIIRHAHEYPEGKWLWIRILKKRNLRDIFVLLLCKKRPHSTLKKTQGA